MRLTHRPTLQTQYEVSPFPMAAGVQMGRGDPSPTCRERPTGWVFPRDPTHQENVVIAKEDDTRAKLTHSAGQAGRMRGQAATLSTVQWAAGLRSKTESLGGLAARGTL